MDQEAQIVVAAETVPSPHDKEPMVRASPRATGIMPLELDADAWYFDKSTIREVTDCHIDVYGSPDNGRATG